MAAQYWFQFTYIMKLGTFALVIFDKAINLISQRFKCKYSRTTRMLLTYLSPHRRLETTACIVSNQNSTYTRSPSFHQRCIGASAKGEKRNEMKRRKKKENGELEERKDVCIVCAATSYSRCFVSRWIEEGVHKIREQTRKTSGKRGRGFDDLLLGHTESWNTGGWVAGRILSDVRVSGQMQEIRGTYGQMFDKLLLPTENVSRPRNLDYSWFWGGGDRG